MKKLYILICFSLVHTIILAQPANDNCASAQSVTPNGSCVSGTTVGANDSWQGGVGCQTGGNHPDVWYTFVSTGSQAQFTVTTSAPWSGDVEVVLVQGTCAAGFAIVGSQCGPSPLTTTIFNGLQPGTTYYYTISSTNNGTPGPFQSCLTTTSPPTIAGQDCSTAAILCNSTTFSQPTSDAGFGTQEVSPANSCWGRGGERQSKWFKFTIGCSGRLEFNINPSNSNDDYDWALWDVTSGCATKGNSIACNWSGCTGSTGISSCIANEPGVETCGSATGGDPCGNGNQPRAWGNWTAPGGGASTCNTSVVSVVAGNTYALLVDNFTFSNSGFTLTFGGACNGGTAKIGPNANFTSSQTSCGLTYNFTKTCPTSNSTFLWQFGDGATASTQNASHTYATAGTYIVTLQITDALGCIATFSQTINTSGPTVLVNSPTVCGGQPATLTANPSVGGGTYSWSPGGQTSQSITVSPASTSNYVVTYSLGGCSSSATSTVTVTAGASVLVNSPTICAGQSATLTANPSIGGGTYSWSPGGQTSQSISVSPATTSNYVVTYSLGGCSSSATSTVTVTAGASVLVNSPTICAGQSATLTANPSVGGGTYSWSPGGQTSQSISVSPVSTSNYVVTYSLGGCSSSATSTVTVTAGPNVLVNSPTICAGQSATLTANPSVGGGTYSWSPGGQTSQSIIVSPASTSNYVVTYSLGGCSRSATSTVTVTAGPNVLVNSPTICSGQSATLTANPSIGGGTYSWSPGGQTSQSITVSPASTSNYVVTYSLGGCSRSATSTVTVAAGATVLVNSPTICTGQSATLTANPSVGGGTYSWSPGGQTSQSITVSPASTSNYVVTYSLGVCSSSATSTVTVTAGPNVLVNSPTICAGQSATLTANPSVGGGTYSWSPGGQTSQSITVSPGSTSNYVVTYSLGGCSRSTTSTVTITGAATVSVNSPTICAGQSATLTANPSVGGGTYSWLPGGQTSQSITISPASTSNYVVTYSVGGCSSSATSTVTVNAAPTVSVNSPTICVGQSATLTATPSIGGGTYFWSPGGQTSQSISVSPASTANYIVTYSSGGCSNSATSTVTVGAAPIVLVNSPTICAGQSATLTANPSVGGGTYSWSPGGQASQSISVSPTSTSNYVVTYSLGGCSSSATSTVTVNSFTPLVSISASSTTICSGAPITFSATSTNGGATPAYQWQINGTNAGTNSSTFTTSSLANGDQVTVILTSNASCITTPTATSNVISITGSSVTPSVSISGSSTSFCTGSSVTFTATSTNGGTTPAYQWQVNGVNAGTNSPTFTTSSLANGDQVTVTMTSNASCITTPTATSNIISITASSVTPAVSISASSTSICTGSSVTFTATPTNGGTAPIYQWHINGVNAGVNSSVFTTSSLANGDQVTVTMTSNATCVTTPTATSNIISVTASSVTPAVSISASSTSICAGSSVTFTATPTNGGPTPAYQWQINGVNAGTNSPTFITSSLANGDQVIVTMTSNASCITIPTATSNVISIIASSLTPSVAISASSTSTCASSSVTFTATPTNGGTTPIYQWQINGVNAGANSPTFTTSSLANGDQVRVTMTSNASCIVTPTATSNVISITASSVTPSVSISATSNSICASSSVTFTAIPSNGGTTPTYQWHINGGNAGANSPTFTTSSLANGDQVTVTMTSNASCITTPTVTSNIISIATNSVIPSVSISASSTSLCAGNSITFTAIPTNGGAAPAYQWQINGVNTATNSSTFITSSLTNGDQVTVTMTSNAGCVTTPTATSNIISITAGSVMPSVSISANSTSICAGSSVTFTATPTNGGTAPAYQWQINGVNAGTNSPAFTTSSLANGDRVTVIMTSNAGCITTAIATSNIISITAGSVTPSVSISANSTSICTGSSITFTATPTNGGATPAYQWQINGLNAGSNSSTFASSSLANGDQVTVILTSNATCVTTPTATSNSIAISAGSVTPSVSISASSTSICAGSSVTFTATPTNGGTAPVYQWQVNGVNTGINSSTLTTSSLANGDKATVMITSNDPCANPVTATGNSIPITVTLAPTGVRYAAITATPNNPLQLQARVLGNNYSYQWSPPVGLNSSSIANPVFTYDKKIEYLIRLTSTNGCVTVDTLLVTMVSAGYVFVPNAWSPNGDGHNDYLYPLTINITQLQYFRVFNRWGQKVFETNIIGKGWDGIYRGRPQPTDVYTWALEAVSADGVNYKLTGHAVLMR